MKYNSITTLNEILEHRPCKDGWRKLLTGLGKTKADDEPLSLMTILEINGLDNAVWCLRATSLERLSRHFQAWCAEQVLHIFEASRPDDNRVRLQIEMLRNDTATEAQRDAVGAAALDAASDAARAALDAAWVAAMDATWAASAATSAAARAATSAATWAATSDAARAAQERRLHEMILDAGE